MKLKLLCVVVVAAMVALAGCKKSPASRYGKDEPIKGSRSDSPVAMTAAWGASNRYHFHLESTTAAEEPRRNTTELVTRETTFGEDFALAVTNAASDGSRILELEVQGLQLDSALGDRVTINFDSGNESLDMNSAPVAERLQKLVGKRLAVHLTPENRVRRVDGLKEINDQLTDRPTTNSTRNVLRGAAGNILSRFFTQQFWREILDLSAVPTNEVRVGDTWVVTRPVTMGAGGGTMTAELTYTFRGWQQHDGRRCARLEFSGTVKPATPGPRPKDVLRNLTAPAPAPNSPGENGTINGVTWFSPDLSLPVETVFDQTITSKVVSAQRPARVVRRTNDPAALVSTNVSAPMVAMTNAPSTTLSATTRQHVSFKLVEVTAYASPAAK